MRQLREKAFRFSVKKNKKKWDEISIKDLQENIKRWNLGAIKIISHTEDAVMKVTRRMLGPKFLPEQSNSSKKLFNKFLFYEHLKKLLKIGNISSVRTFLDDVFYP